MSIEAMKAALGALVRAEMMHCQPNKEIQDRLREAIAAAEKAESDTAALLAEKDAMLRQAMEALEGFVHITNDSQGVAGYHLSGDTAEWDEFDEVDAASNTIEAIRNHLGVKP